MSGPGEPERFNTVVIGGGQAGLAAGHHLRQRGCDFVILDACERIGDSWRNRWESLRLFTPARYNGLPGLPFPAPPHHFPTKDEMGDYLEAYAEQFALPVRSGIKVEGLSKQNGQFVMTATDASTGAPQALHLEAENVVVATGAYQQPQIPTFASELDPGILQLHSSEYRRPSDLQEGATLVVGAANSGAEIALELSQSRQVWLSGRHPGSEPARPGSSLDRLILPLMWFVFSHVLNVKTPIGRKLRPKMLAMGGIPLARIRPADLRAAGVERVHARTVGVRGGKPLLADDRVLDVNNVVWCSGFRPDYSWIDLPIFGEKEVPGEPPHQRGVVASEPGLYFVGLFFLSAVTSSLVGGVGRDAAYVVEHLMSRNSSGP